MHGEREPAVNTGGRIALYTLSNGMFWWRVYVLVFLLTVVDALLTDSEPMVSTKWGLLRGKWSRSLRDRPVANFLGIPYAQAPVDDLRFKSPQRWNRTWTTIRDATVDGESCAQISLNLEISGSEDCLYLNIFVPVVSGNQQESTKLPVLVFVHGGAYMLHNSDSRLYAPDYLMDQEIILVTLNYRLNIIGFFSTTNQASPGNYGLKDIWMALQWIQENIRSFGGNPKAVTLMGSSAGSAAVHALVLTNKTEGLFDKYIMHSGSTTSMWAVHPNRQYRRLCLELARLVGCLPKQDDVPIATTSETIAENVDVENGTTPIGNVYDNILISEDRVDYNVTKDEEMMKCMRRVDAARILKMFKYYIVWRNNPRCIFGPTLEEDSDEAILTAHPVKALKDGQFRDIPAIMLVTMDESLVKTIVFYTDLEAEDEMIENFKRYLPHVGEYQDVIPNNSVLTATLRDFYFKGNLTSDFKRSISEMLTDTIVTWPMYQAVKYKSEMGTSNTYFSLFAYEGTFTSTFSSGSPIHYGISHVDDLNYLFPFLTNTFKDLQLHNTESDLTMINIMTEMWGNFVKDGIPRAWMVPEWPDYRDHQQFMRFGIGKSPDIVVQDDFLSDRMEFWEKLIANLSAEWPVDRDVYVGVPPDEMASANADTAHRVLQVHLVLLAMIALFSV